MVDILCVEISNLIRFAGSKYQEIAEVARVNEALTEKEKQLSAENSRLVATSETFIHEKEMLIKRADAAEKKLCDREAIVAEEVRLLSTKIDDLSVENLTLNSDKMSYSAVFFCDFL